MKIQSVVLGILLILISSLGFAQHLKLTNLKNGDLIFVEAEREHLSGAINRVTQRDTNSSFDHIGLLEYDQGNFFVLHASSKKGSIREGIDSFYQTQKKEHNHLVVYRLKEAYQHTIPQAISTAKLLLGKPYNWSYILNDSSLYCSDFIERAFRHGHIFQLEPMTFINPATGQIDSFWRDFYQKQGLEVPEGELGCNPNGLAASEKLVKIGDLTL